MISLDGAAVSRFVARTGEDRGSVAAFLSAPGETGYEAGAPCLLAPCDVHAIKACGVTFAHSMIERLNDEPIKETQRASRAIGRRVVVMKHALTDMGVERAMTEGPAPPSRSTGARVRRR